MAKKITDQSDSANSIVKNHMIWSMGAGFIPVPFADLFAVSAIQLDMIRQLCKLYDVDFKETEGKAIITALTGASVARIGAQAIKFIPGVGSVLGGISMSVLSGGSTYALGEVFKKHFETGGTFLDFDPSRLKRYYNDKFEKGKEIARELKRKQDAQRDTLLLSDGPQKDTVGQLKELGQMKKDGLITEAEFKKLKKKLVDGDA